MKRLLGFTLLLGASICVAQDSRPIATMSSPGPLTFASVCDGGRELIGVVKDQGVFVWDVASGKATPLGIKTKRASDGNCASSSQYAALTVVREGRIVVVDLRK